MNHTLRCATMDAHTTKLDERLHRTHFDAWSKKYKNRPRATTPKRKRSANYEKDCEKRTARRLSILVSRRVMRKNNVGSQDALDTVGNADIDRTPSDAPPPQPLVGAKAEGSRIEDLPHVRCATTADETAFSDWVLLGASECAGEGKDDTSRRGRALIVRLWEFLGTRRSESRLS